MRVAGIKIEKDGRGNPTLAHIDLKKHGEALLPYLEKVGAIKEDEFEKWWSRSITGEELTAEVNKRIDKWKKPR